MRVLVRIVTSTVYDVFPLFMVKVDGLNDEETDVLISVLSLNIQVMTLIQ